MPGLTADIPNISNLALSHARWPWPWPLSQNFTLKFELLEEVLEVTDIYLPTATMITQIDATSLFMSPDKLGFHSSDRSELFEVRLLAWAWVLKNQLEVADES